MKKVKWIDKDELRAEYKRSDFPKGFVRGKYAERLRESSNVVVLKPEVAQASPLGATAVLFSFSFIFLKANYLIQPLSGLF